MTSSPIVPVAWRDRRDERNSIYATRVAANGTVQDTNGFLVESGSETGGVHGPAVAAAPGSNRWAVDYGLFLADGVPQRIAAN